VLLCVAIETGSATVATEMTTRDAELRDIILTSLGTKTVEQLTDMSTRAGIKAEVHSAITARFGKNAGCVGTAGCRRLCGRGRVQAVPRVGVQGMDGIAPRGCDAGSERVDGARELRRRKVQVLRHRVQVFQARR
jgi:hypothetical protein